LFGVRRGDPNPDFPAPVAEADTTAHADQKSEVFLNVGLPFYRKAPIASEAGLNTTDNRNWREAIKL
jgi:hypothetical protein